MAYRVGQDDEDKKKRLQQSRQMAANTLSEQKQAQAQGTSAPLPMVNREKAKPGANANTDGEKPERQTKLFMYGNLARRGDEYIKLTEAGGEQLNTYTSVTVDLARYTPADIAKIAYQTPEGEREANAKTMINYYKKAGMEVPTLSDVSAQWKEWDKTGEAARTDRAIQKKQEEARAGDAALGGIAGAQAPMSSLEMNAVIAGMLDGGEKEEALKLYAQQTGTPGSAYYNPYMAGNTNWTAQTAFGNVEITPDWIAQNAALEAGYVIDSANKIVNPGKTATDEQKKSWAYKLIKDAEPATVAAEGEMARLLEEIADISQGLSAADIYEAVSEIEITKKEYPTLYAMQEAQAKGETVTLNRAVPMSRDVLLGAGYCAANGIEVTDAREYALYGGALLNQIKQDAKKGTPEEEPQDIWQWIGKAINDATFGRGEAQAREEDRQTAAHAQDVLAQLGIKDGTQEETEPEATRAKEQEQAAQPYGPEKPQSEKGQETQETTQPEEDENGKLIVYGADGKKAETAQPFGPERPETVETEKIEPFQFVSVAKAEGTETDKTPGEAERKSEPTKTVAEVRAAAGEENIRTDRVEEIPWMQKAELSFKDAVGKFQGRNYSFVKNASDQAALEKLDRQIDLYTQQMKQLEEENARDGLALAASRNPWDIGAMSGWNAISEEDERRWKENKAAADDLRWRIAQLNSKRISIAFSGEPQVLGVDATIRAISTMGAPQAQEAQTEKEEETGEGFNAQSTTAFMLWIGAASEDTQAISQEREEEIARIKEEYAGDEIAQADEIERVNAQYDTALYEHEVRVSTLKRLIPQDIKTAELHAQAGPERIRMLCEREVARALWQEDRVEEITNAMIEAGYPPCWPEEEEAVRQAEEAEAYRAETEREEAIEYARQWGDDAVRERLGIEDGRELTEDDYYTAAHTKKEGAAGGRKTGLRETGGMTDELGEKIEIYKALGYTEDEATYRGLAEWAMGEEASIDEVRRWANIFALGPAAYNGVIGGISGIGQGVTKTVSEMALDFAKVQYGPNLTREQIYMISPGYKYVSDMETGLDEAVEGLQMDISGRAGYVQTVEALSESVTQNVVAALAGGAVGKTVTVMGRFTGIRDMATLARLYKRASSLTTNTVFALGSMGGNIAEAREAGLEGAEAVTWAAGATAISTAIENANIDPFTKSARTMKGILPDAQDAAKKGYKAVTAAAVQWMKSGAGEALEEIVEDPLQGGYRKATIAPETPWMGEGGVIDPKRAAGAGAMGFAAGMLLGGVQFTADVKAALRTDMETRAQAEAQQAQPGTEQAQAEAQQAQPETEQAQPGTEQAQPETEQEEKKPEKPAKTAQETIMQNAQDVQAIAQAAESQYVSPATQEAIRNALSEMTREGQMSEETRSGLNAMLALDRIRAKLITQDMGFAAALYGSEETGAATKKLAEAAIERIAGTETELEPQMRRELLESAARDRAKAVAREEVRPLRETAEAAHRQYAKARAEYGQVNGRLKGITENLVNQMGQIQGKEVTQAAQGEYVKSLNKLGTLTRQVENAKERMQGARKASEEANGAYEAARQNAKARETEVFEQLMAEMQGGGQKETGAAQTEQNGQKTENTDTQTQQTQAQQPKAKANPEAQAMQALEDGDEAGAVKIVRQSVAGYNSEKNGWTDPGDDVYFSKRTREKGAKTQEEAGQQEQKKFGQRVRDWLDEIRGKRKGAASLQQMGEQMRKAFPGLTVREGSAYYNVNVEGGYTDAQTGEAHVIGSGNVLDMAHEIGHQMSIKSGICDAERTAKGRIVEGTLNVKEEYREAVDEMARKMELEAPDTFNAQEYAKPEARRMEALAEVFARYIQQGEAAARAFAGEEIYGKLTGALTKEQMNTLRQVRSEYAALNTATIIAQGEAQVVDRENEERRRMDMAERNAMDGLKEYWADEYRGFHNVVQKEVESVRAGMTREEWKKYKKERAKRGELTIEEADEVYIKAANLSKAKGVVHLFVNNKIVDRNGNVLINKSIAEMVRPIARENVRTFEAYIMLKNELDTRNLRERRMSEAQESGGTYRPMADESYNKAWAQYGKADIEAEIARIDAEHPEFAGVHKELVSAFKAVRESYLIKPGYIEDAQENWERVLAARPNYIPTRVLELGAVMENARNGGGMAKDRPDLRGARAGDRDVISPITTMLQEMAGDVYKSAVMELKNTMARVYDEYSGMGEMYYEITPDEAGIEVEREIARRNGAQSIGAQDMTSEELRRLIGAADTADRGDVFVAVKDGKARYFRIVDQALYNAMEGARNAAQAQQMGKIGRKVIKATQLLNNFFRATTTIMNPYFAIPNVVRDTQTGQIFGQHPGLARMGEAFTARIRAFAEIAKYNFTGRIEEGSDIYKFAAMGGLEGDAYAHDVEGEREAMGDLFGEKKRALARLWDGAAELIGKFNDTLEGGTRYYQFTMGLKMNQGTERAFRMSQEATTDFARKGAGKLAAVARQGIFFFNAQVQDTYGLLNALERRDIDPGRARAVLSRSLTNILVPGLAEALIRMLTWSEEDKEKYDALADNVKQENYVIGFMGEKAVFIPKGQNVLFTAMGIPADILSKMDREVRNGGDVRSYMRHEFGDDITQAVEAVVESVNPFGNFVFQTPLDIMNNRNHWGDEIVPEWMQGYDKINQTDAYTSTAANFLSRLTGGMISPKVIHYALDQQTGVAGDLLLGMTTPAKGYGKALEDSEGILDFALSNAAGFARLNLDLLTKRFSRDVSAVSAARSDFYTYQDFFDTTVKQLEETGADPQKNKDRINIALSGKERKNAQEDAKDMKAYLSGVNREVREINEKIKKNPEMADEYQADILELLMKGCHVAESWQRRYMNGDMSVKVKIP